MLISGCLGVSTFTDKRTGAMQTELSEEPILNDLMAPLSTSDIVGVESDFWLNHAELPRAINISHQLDQHSEVRASFKP